MAKAGGDATKDLGRLARYFREEIGKRDWGAHEFKKLIAESAAAKEKVDASEREAVRRVLAQIDRMESLRQGGLAAIEVLERSPGGPIELAAVRDVVQAFRQQAGLAVADAFAALLASAGPAPRRTGASLRAEVTRLAAQRPSVSDERASLAAIGALSPRRKGKLNPFAKSLQDALAAAAFLDRAVGRVEDLVSPERRRAGSVSRAALRDIFLFVARSAEFVKNLVTLRLASAGGKG